MNAAAPVWGTIFHMELREYRFHPRAWHLVPALVAGVLWTAWAPPSLPPILPVSVAVIAALEPQYANILARHPREREALTLLPVPWGVIVSAKNCAAIVLTAAVYVAALCTLGYFAEQPVTGGVLRDSAIYLWSVLFPLLIFGNFVSVRWMRRECGLRREDVASALLMVAAFLVVSVPYILLPDLVLLLYGGAGCVLWLRVSIPATARTIASSFPPGEETL